MSVVDYNSVDWSSIYYYDETSPTFLRFKNDVYKGRHKHIKVASAGDPAGWVIKGYFKVKYNRENYYAHRVAWILLNGSIDNCFQVDHIDGNRLNNNINNLRLVDHKTNARNRKAYSNNNTGFTGVCFYSKRNAYVVSCRCLDGKNIVEYFKVSEYGDKAFELAVARRITLMQELNESGAGYTERHILGDSPSVISY